ncbi:MAG: alanine--tRNA ligase [Bacteroidales bacterium]|nr:alanine--tRNA ligase [Bacteroidales bacterium]MBQ7017579.1 alanine--tRNA ligase [Bacteroidales bacterium]
MTSNQIRECFLEFFRSKNHTIVPSAPMVVKDDPTLMFTNAGMNQFKDWFLGNSQVKYHRVADSQKCLRVSGKHNDLEEVGHDTYHHTMFEMLGNWSFGDYFKTEAIDWAWELLTEVYKLDKDRLYATVFEGSEQDGVAMDQEAKDAWLKHLPAERIILGNKKDNFWEMGETGPCGPCSEIHIDLRSDEERAQVPGVELVNKSHHLVIEIWNLVFMQYNRKANGSLEPLPQKHVDTGMGLERLCMALQAKKSNYDTDVFQNMIAEISHLTGVEYNADGNTGVAMRVIADHIRAISFSIADGQLPSNVKAGYVIRRILRRAVRYAYTFLKMDQPLLCRLVPTLVAQMGDAFPELKQQQGIVEKVIKEEEEAFLRTLDKGIKLMDNIIKNNAESKMVSGKDAFVLYDTFGFPIDLTELIAKEHGYTVDLNEFEAELQQQKNRSRNATAVEEGDWVEVHPYSATEFTGYDSTREENVKLLKYRKVKAKNKESVQLVFDKSPFYAESGGQTGDSGHIVFPGGEKIEIVNTIKENGLPVHIATAVPSDPAATFTAEIDTARRQSITNNHTATHLLHKALRETLGTHIEQKGSSVTATGFRFDFSHFEKIDAATLRNVEKLVNRYIRENRPRTEFRNLPIDEAKAKGAMALFGEKYGDTVRVIQYGDSIELCGGTHVEATGNIGIFKILSEGAVAAGIRRIEATTGENAENLLYAAEDMILQIKSFFNNTPNLTGSIKKLITDNDALKKNAEEFMKERAITLKDTLLKSAKDINGYNVIAVKGIFLPEVIKNVANLLKQECNNTVFIAATSHEEKPSLTLMYTDDLTAKGSNAGKDIREAAKLINGGGGGQPFLATAGGKNMDGLNAAFDKLIETATK